MSKFPGILLVKDPLREVKAHIDRDNETTGFNQERSESLVSLSLSGFNGSFLPTYRKDRQTLHPSVNRCVT